MHTGMPSVHEPSLGPDRAKTRVLPSQGLVCSSVLPGPTCSLDAGRAPRPATAELQAGGAPQAAPLTAGGLTVKAMVQILAVKQALATRARLMAKVAAKQMQHHLIATTGQDPWERQSKRARQ